MKFKFYSIASLFSLLFMYMCSEAQNIDIKHVDTKTFNQLIKTEKGVVIDVRTPREFNSGHIEDAINININDNNFNQEIQKLPKNSPIYVYCYSGSRSRSASMQLISLGFTKVYNLSNGMIGWTRESLPVVKSNSASQSTVQAENMYNPEQFNTLLASSSMVFIDFYAPWCIPCKEMAPMIEELKKEYQGKIKIEKINTDPSKDLVKQLQINAIPYLVLYKDGAKVYEKEGKVTKEELVSQFQKYIN